jgi:hypothetical protein
MTAPHQDFDAPSGSPSYSGTFTLGGRVWKIRSRDDVPFEIVRRLMGQPTLDRNASAEEQAESAREVVMQTGPFFEATIVEDEVPDFMLMFSDPKSALTLGKLKPVMEYVSKIVFTEDEEQRPTKPLRRSQPGRLATGATSEGSSSSRAIPRKASAS